MLAFPLPVVAYLRLYIIITPGGAIAPPRIVSDLLRLQQAVCLVVKQFWERNLKRVTGSG